MKKIALILVTLSVFIVILYFTINVNNTKNQKPIICGNGICEKSEESYCLDCNLSCRSELCNSKINIICDNCSETQKKLLPKLFEHQNTIYNCLSDFFSYRPPRLIYHTILQNDVTKSCFKEEGCYITGGITENLEINQGFIPGLRERNETDVTKEENVGFEIHELVHIFTHYALGNLVPAWFDEGISIYAESRFLCHPNLILSSRFDSSTKNYKKLKEGKLKLEEIAPFDEWYKTKYDNHIIGMLYFSALEQDYNCDKECITKILFTLYQHRKNCVGICFEKARNSTSDKINSINMNDLRIKIITNEIIKQKSEEIIGQDLTPLFSLLQIN